MQPIDTKPLRSAIRETAIALHKNGVTSPADFVAKFHVDHPEHCENFAEYGFDQFLKREGRAVMKKVGGEIVDAYTDRQMSFEGIAEDLDLPSILPVRREGQEPAWVPLKHGKIEDGDQYRDMLLANIQACTKLATDWGVFWGVVRPYLEANPDWTIADAVNAELAKKT